MHGAFGVIWHRLSGLKTKNLAINTLRSRRIFPKTYSSKTFYELSSGEGKRFG
jgi:hypothetical protein